MLWSNFILGLIFYFLLGMVYDNEIETKENEKVKRRI